MKFPDRHGAFCPNRRERPGIPRAELAGPGKRPLEPETWAGAVDTVGGEMLGRILAQMKYGGSVAAVGLAGGAQLTHTVVPFLLRGVNLLGIDSVMQPYEQRVKAWSRIAGLLPADMLDAMIVPAALNDLPALGADILAGRVRGRVVVEIGA